MCGIYGFALKPGANKTAAIAKFKILGLYNIKRGRDASGVFIDGHILKSTKEFDDFVEETNFTSEFENTIVLGHNRQGSVGYKKTIEEAHPFLINDNLIFTHNGTIENTYDLCKKYELKKEDFNVDSQILGTLLYTEGVKILPEYKGYAALAYTHLDEPNTLYLYHGKSKKYKAGQPEEERPLYFLETKEGIFYSSLEESLKAIKEDKDEVVNNLNHNIVFKIVNGEFDMDSSSEIERGDINVFVQQSSTHIPHNSRAYNNYNNYEAYTSHLNSSPGAIKNYRLVTRESYPIKLIEALQRNEEVNFGFWREGRFWLDSTTLVDGPIYIKKGGYITNADDKSGELCFFFRGVFLKDASAYKKIVELKNQLNTINWVLNPKDFNFASEISQYSIYPITNILDEGDNYNMHYNFQYRWYKNKNSGSDTSWTPKFSGRNYTIKDGILTDIKSSQREECLLGSAYDVRMQLEKAIKNSTPGGSQLSIVPFQKQLETPVYWFFERTYKDLETFYKYWKEAELEALYRFVKYSYERDFSMKDYSGKEISDTCDNIILCSINKGVSVGTFLEEDTKDDSKLLLKFYNDYLKEKKEKPKVNITLPKEEEKEEVSTISKVIEYTEIDDDTLDDDDDIESTLEDCLVDFENIQASIGEILVVENEDNDFAQEIGAVLLNSIESTLCNLSYVFEKFNKEELLRRAKKIRENKAIKNGIL